MFLFDVWHPEGATSNSIDKIYHTRHMGLGGSTSVQVQIPSQDVGVDPCQQHTIVKHQPGSWISQIRGGWSDTHVKTHCHIYYIRNIGTCDTALGTCMGPDVCIRCDTRKNSRLPQVTFKIMVDTARKKRRSSMLECDGCLLCSDATRRNS